MISKEDPLKNLYVDKEEVDRLRLFVSLKNFLAIDKGTASPVFLEEYFELDNKNKMIVYMLYRRAIAALGRISSDEIGISIRDLSSELGMDFHEVKKNLKDIDSVTNDRGRYFIPADNLEMAVKELGHKADIYYSTEKNTRRIR